MPSSKSRGPTAIAGILRFTGDETVFTPLRVEGAACVSLTGKAVGSLPYPTGMSASPSVTLHGLPTRGRFHDRSSIEDRSEEASTRVPEGSELQADRSPASEIFGPQWGMMEFYLSIESKSVYEAEDLVLSRLGDSGNVLTSGA